MVGIDDSIDRLKVSVLLLRGLAMRSLRVAGLGEQLARGWTHIVCRRPRMSKFGLEGWVDEHFSFRVDVVFIVGGHFASSSRFLNQV